MVGRKECKKDRGKEGERQREEEQEEFDSPRLMAFRLKNSSYTYRER